MGGGITSVFIRLVNVGPVYLYRANIMYHGLGFDFNESCLSAFQFGLQQSDQSSAL